MTIRTSNVKHFLQIDSAVCFGQTRLVLHARSDRHDQTRRLFLCGGRDRVQLVRTSVQAQLLPFVGRIRDQSASSFLLLHVQKSAQAESRPLGRLHHREDRHSDHQRRGLFRGFRRFRKRHLDRSDQDVGHFCHPLHANWSSFFGRCRVLSAGDAGAG